MKKIVMLVVIAIVTCFSAICLAAGNGALLSAEEKIADGMFQYFAGKAEFETVAPYLNPNEKELPKAVRSLKKDIAEKIGGIGTPVFRVYEKTAVRTKDGKIFPLENVVYFSQSSKKQNVQWIFTFSVSDNKPTLRLVNSRIILPPKPQAKKAE